MIATASSWILYAGSGTGFILLMRGFRRLAYRWGN